MAAPLEPTQPWAFMQAGSARFFLEAKNRVPRPVVWQPATQVHRGQGRARGGASAPQLGVIAGGGEGPQSQARWSPLRSGQSKAGPVRQSSGPAPGRVGSSGRRLVAGQSGGCSRGWRGGSCVQRGGVASTGTHGSGAGDRGDHRWVAGGRSRMEEGGQQRGQIGVGMGGRRTEGAGWWTHR